MTVDPIHFFLKSIAETRRSAHTWFKCRVYRVMILGTSITLEARLIRLENATKFMVNRSGRKPILNGVSLTLNRGRSIGLLGRNGAGKSTLLQIIAGSMRLDGGRIVRNAKISWPLGFKGGFHATMTGEQNVRFIARLYGVDTDELVAYVREFAELGTFFNEPLGSYSSGMKARLAFGVSMGIAFDFYLVDEITAVGDANFKRKSKEVFQERLVNSDVIMVSHSMSTLRSYCDCGIVLEGGNIQFYEDINDAIETHMQNMNSSYSR